MEETAAMEGTVAAEDTTAEEDTATKEEEEDADGGGEDVDSWRTLSTIITKYFMLLYIYLV